MLAIALKSLVQAVKVRRSSDVAALYESQQFIQSVSYLAMQGTGFSEHWIITDLEVSSRFIISCITLPSIQHKRVLEQACRLSCLSV